ncbi:hypothetical protein BY996DRAFT_4528968, partial [Phakopsora pachyrhizi]
LASFGVELLRLIGSKYSTKAFTHMKLHYPGFIENTKQKGMMIKEVWGLLSSTL